MGAIVLALLVVLPSIAAVSLEVFYPFGPEKMDNILQPGDDTSSMMVELRDPVVFYNNSYKSLFVSFCFCFVFATIVAARLVIAVAVVLKVVVVVAVIISASATTK